MATSERACPVCQAPATFRAWFGAPGIGQAWECQQGHALALVGGQLIDQAGPWDSDPPWVMPAPVIDWEEEDRRGRM